MTTSYTQSFYSAQQGGSRRSAEVVVPLVMALVGPASIVDVGCGVGTWLSVFHQHGVQEFLGLDGHYVDRTMLQIPESHFQPYDLKQPLQLDQTFDLAMSLEVAEHLPETCAETFVESLTRLAPIVLFSAAIPHQGGTHHVNEQWPEYWAAIFEKRGYQVIDGLRSHIWNNQNVDWCYAQNILLYARPEAIESRPALKRLQAHTSPNQLSMVHPLKYLEQCDPNHITVRRLVDWLPVLMGGLPRIVANAAKRRLK